MIASPPVIKVRLYVASGPHVGEGVRVRGPRFVIGRDEGCDFRAGHEKLSRRHAEIDILGEVVVVRDLCSRNGTRLNGVPITRPTPLRDGDRIALGPLALIVSIDADGDSDSGSGPVELSREDEAAMEAVLDSMREGEPARP